LRLLLDTHALLWALVAPEKLPAFARRAVQAPENEVYASLASAWEIAIKTALGRLAFEVRSMEATLAASGIQALEVGFQHASRVADLPHHHGDPFDRMLVAQALCESMILVSRDRELKRYGIRMLWKEASAP
jgi:PIN domain nuclease of toxin-antitoxin system